MRRGKCFPFLVALFLAQFADASSWRIINSFKSEATGLAWDGQYLWSSSNSSKSVLIKTNPVDGTVVERVSIRRIPGDAEDLTFLKGKLWVVDNRALYPSARVSLRKYDAVTLVEETGLSFDFSSLPRNPANPANNEMNGLGNDGEYLWINYNGIYFMQIDPENGAILHSWSNTAYGYTDGIEFAWGHMFFYCWQQTIYEVDPCTGVLFEAYNPTAKLAGGEGLTFDGEHLWIADDLGDHIYELELINDYLTKRPALGKTEIACADEPNPVQVSLAPKVVSCSVYPNPFTARVTFFLPAGDDADLTLKIFDLHGRKTADLSNGFRRSASGVCTADWNTEQNPPGVYFAEIRYNGVRERLKLLLVR